MKRREAILLLVLVPTAIIYAIVDDSPVPPSADAQEPVAVACLKRAGFNVKSDIYSGGSLPSNGSNVQYEDEGGARVAIIYLADLAGDIDLFAGSDRAGAIHDCVERAAKAKET